MPQPAKADCSDVCDPDAPVYAVGDQVFVRAEIRRLDHDGRVVMLSIPAVLGNGLNYIVAPPSCLVPPREARTGNGRDLPGHEAGVLIFEGR